MKKFPLSGLKQKLTCLFIIFIFILINLLNFYIFPFSNTVRFAFFSLSVIISILYAYVIFSPIVLIDENNKLVTVKMMKRTTIDLNQVTDITLENRIVQNKTVKVIIFSNLKETVGIINTFFTEKQDKEVEEIINTCKALLH